MFHVSPPKLKINSLSRNENYWYLTSAVVTQLSALVLRFIQVFQNLKTVISDHIESDVSNIM
jgi:hypothetical protein